MRHLKLLSILYLFPGFYLFAMHIGFYRVVAANSGFPFGAGICTLMAFALWATAGIILYPFKSKSSAVSISILLALLYPASISSIICAKLFSFHAEATTMVRMLAATTTAALPIGIVTGLIIGALTQPIITRGVKASAFFSAAGYLLAGFILYPSGIFQLFMQPSLLVIQGILLVLPLTMLAFSFPFKLLKKMTLLSFASIACILGLILFQVDQAFTYWFWTHQYKSAIPLKFYQTQSGRLTLLLQKETGNPDQILIIRNNHLLCKVPSNATVSPGMALPLALESDKLKLNVLIISHPFTPLPAAMSSLPFVKHVTLLSPDIIMNKIAQKYRVLPQPSDKMSIAEEFLPHFLKANKQVFDIVWFVPGSEKELVALPKVMSRLKRHISTNGILTVPAVTIKKRNLKTTLSKYFERSAPLPGSKKYICYGSKNITSDITTLESRLEKFQRNEGVVLFPRGAFSVLYELNQLPDVKPEFKQNVARKLPSIILLTTRFSNLGIPALAIAAILGAFYIIIRFMLCRKNALFRHAGLFENGFATAGFTILLFSATFSSRALAYSNFGYILASASCATFGLLLSGRIRSGRLTVVISLLLLAALYPVHNLGWNSLAILVIALNFLCSGIIAEKIISPPRKFSRRLLAANYFGYLIGAIILFVLIFFKFELYVLCFVIILSRIPVIMSKLVLGKEPKG
ncbi:MAG: hypothetical protein GY718_04710 [Lentisphaerae bacterium]|nr:hypothetical protein [Lentisphaerota bacterium]